MVKINPAPRPKGRGFLKGIPIVSAQRHFDNKGRGITRCRVKICGITNLEDALCAVKLGVDALGFVFWKKSPRYIKPQTAKPIIERLPLFVNAVGVFVDEKERNVKRIASYCGLDILQFHGNESSSYCKRFKGYRIIKAFRIKDKIDVKKISQYNVDAYLFDTYQNGLPGGTGKTFNWNLIKQIRGFKKPIILSGGLNPNNVKKAIKNVAPYAVDASSSLESFPAKKDYRLMNAFLTSIKNNKL